MKRDANFNFARWAIFVLIALAAVIPLLYTFSLPTFTSSVVQDLYDTIEKMEPGKPVMISFDFDPGSEAELEPMARCLMRHCFRKHLRVVTTTLYMPASVPLMRKIVDDMVGEMPKDEKVPCTPQEGKDFVVLGYQAGTMSPILNMGQDFYMTFPTNQKKEKLKGQEVMKGINTLKDFPLVITLSAGNLPDYWITYGQDKQKFKLGLGCTAVMATDYYPYLQSKQLTGLLGGLAGAYQYENLVGVKERATEAMRPQTAIHLVIIGLILVGNLLYFTSKRSK